MIENFGVENPCRKCPVHGVCEAKEDECFELRNYMSLFRSESIKRGRSVDEEEEVTFEGFPDKAFSVPFIVDVDYIKNENDNYYTTIVKWSDNTITQYTHSVEYNQIDGPRLGMSMCVMEKLYGNNMCDNLLNNLYKEMANNGKEKA